MANRNEEIAIILKTIGAAAAARDIEKVSKATKDLHKKVDEHTDVVKDNTDALEGNADALDTNTKSTDKKTERTKVAVKNQSEYNKAIVQSSKLLKDLHKATSTATAGASRYDRQRLAGIKAQQREVKALDNLEKAAARNRSRIDKSYIGTYTMLTKRGGPLHSFTKMTQQRITLAKEAEKAAIREGITTRREAERTAKAVIAAHKRTEAAKAKFYSKITPKINNLHVPEFRRPLQVLKWTSIIFGVLDLIPLIGTALNSVAAGAIGAVRALAPLVGLLGTIPGAILAFSQLGIVMHVAFNHIGAALGGSKAAMKKLSKNAQDFVKEVKRATRPLKDLRNDIQSAMFAGIGNLIGTLVKTWLPTLDRTLTQTATYVNWVATEFGGWLASADGIKVITGLLDNSNTIIFTGLRAFSGFTKVFLRLGNIAGPVLTRMVGDLEHFAFWLDDMVNTNSDGIAGFFDRAYDSIKRTGRVLKNFIIGFYNIFNNSESMSGFLADNIERISEQFLKWTQETDNIQKIKDYFKEMQEPLKALAHFAWRLAKAIFDVSRSPNFVKLVDSLRKDLIPSLENIIKAVDGNFITMVAEFVEKLSELITPENVKLFHEIGMKVLEVVGILINGYQQAPKFIKSAILWGVVLLGIFGGVANALINILKLMVGVPKGLMGIRSAFNGWRGAAAAEGVVASGAKRAMVDENGNVVVAGKSGKGRRGGTGSSGGGSSTTVFTQRSTGFDPKRSYSAVGGAYLAEEGVARRAYIPNSTTGAASIISGGAFGAASGAPMVITRSAGVGGRTGAGSAFLYTGGGSRNPFAGGVAKGAIPASFLTGVGSTPTRTGVTSKPAFDYKRAYSGVGSPFIIPGESGSMKTPVESAKPRHLMTANELIASGAAGSYADSKKSRGRGIRSRIPKGNGAVRGAAGGIAAMIGAGIVLDATGRILGQGRNDALANADRQSQSTVGALAAGGAGGITSLDSFFKIGSGFDNFKDALKGIANPTGFDKFTINVGNAINGAVGMTSASEVAKQKFEAMDTALANMPVDQAQAAFKVIKDSAEQQRVPMDKLVDLFPQYTDAVQQIVDPVTGASNVMNDAGNAAYYMSGGLDALKHSISRSKSNELEDDLNRALGLGLNQTRIGLYTGGTAPGGVATLVGEKGPELAMTRGGGIGLVGMGGPHMFKPSVDTAIIPNSATTNLMDGSYGNAPGWAKNALQNAVNNQGKGKAAGLPQAQAEPSNGNDGMHLSIGKIVVGGGSGSTARDIESAVYSAYQRMIRDQKERR